jgi:hypothetical protein
MNFKFKILTFANFLENISKEKFLLENDGKKVMKKNWGGSLCKFLKSPKFRNTNFNCVYGYFKGSVQRKLRWVETGVNRWVWASDRGAGHYFIL